MEKYKNCMRPRKLGDKKANETENMAEIVFLWGESEIQCLIYRVSQKNGVQLPTLIAELKLDRIK